MRPSAGEVRLSSGAHRPPTLFPSFELDCVPPLRHQIHRPPLYMHHYHTATSLPYCLRRSNEARRLAPPSSTSLLLSLFSFNSLSISAAATFSGPLTDLPELEKHARLDHYLRGCHELLIFLQLRLPRFTSLFDLTHRSIASPGASLPSLDALRHSAATPLSRNVVDGHVSIEPAPPPSFHRPTLPQGRSLCIARSATVNVEKLRHARQHFLVGMKCTPSFFLFSERSFLCLCLGFCRLEQHAHRSGPLSGSSTARSSLAAVAEREKRDLFFELSSRAAHRLSRAESPLAVHYDRRLQLRFCERDRMKGEDEMRASNARERKRWNSGKGRRRSSRAWYDRALVSSCSLASCYHSDGS
jgi:hypothetical protein